jgi:hypothetical protein
VLREQRALNVRFIVVHRAFYEVAVYTSLLDRTANWLEFKSDGHYRDPVSEAQSSNCGGDGKKSWPNSPLMRYRLRPIDCQPARRTKR